MSSRRLEALLIRARERLATLGKEDEGEELLYTNEFLEEVMAAAKRSPSSLDNKSRAELIALIRLLGRFADDDAEAPPDTRAVRDALEGVSLGDRAAPPMGTAPSEPPSPARKAPRKSGRKKRR